MQEPTSDLSLLELLNQLERTVLADPELRIEWDTAWTSFSDNSSAGVEQYLRFKEYFLLERCADKLGLPPVVAFAPKETTANSSWDGLHDSFLGIFKFQGNADGGMAQLVDLWSGGLVLCPIPGDSWPGGTQSVAIGRFVLGEDGIHLPLPGLSFLEAEGLTESLEMDLNAERARNPRARLSQLRCEDLLNRFPHRLLHAPVLGDSAPDLFDLIADQEDWDATRLETILNDGGPAELLSQLAFDSDVDMELARQAVHQLVSQAPTPGFGHLPGSDEDVIDQNEVAAALKKLDSSRNNGRSMDRLFEVFCKDLGVVASSDLDLDLDSPRHDFGPDDAVGLMVWTETWEWEATAAGNKLSPRSLSAAREFCKWTEQRLENKSDASDIRPDWVLSWLSSLRDSKIITEMMGGVMPFLVWIEQEQDAQLDQLAEKLAGPLGKRLVALAQLNTELKGNNGAGTSVCTLSADNPPRVVAENDKLAPVSGIPSTAENQLKTGDQLLGRWDEGSFLVCAVVAKEAVPPDNSSEE